MYNTPYSERMNLKGHVQGFTVGAAVMGALMLGLPLLAAPTSPHDDMDELAAQFGVEIVWTSVNPCAVIRSDADGCYSHATPSRIYVSPDMELKITRYVVLHEIGHAIQARLGLPIDECAADKFAQSLGTWRGAYCKSH